MKTLTLILLLTCSSFADELHNIRITCTFKAIAKGYKSFTVSDKFVISDEGILTNNGVYGRVLPYDDKDRKMFAGLPTYYPVLCIPNGKDNSYIFPTDFKMMPYSEFRHHSMRQDERIGTFTCKVSDGWKK